MYTQVTFIQFFSGMLIMSGMQLLIRSQSWTSQPQTDEQVSNMTAVISQRDFKHFWWLSDRI
jgi:hypothetical protein